MDPGNSKLHLIAFYTQLMILVELNYDIYNKELLAIIKAFKQWQAYLKVASYYIQVYSNYNNL